MNVIRVMNRTVARVYGAPVQVAIVVEISGGTPESCSFYSNSPGYKCSICLLVFNSFGSKQEPKSDSRKNLLSP